ncbi:MAG: endonuclease V [Anaerolineae bacterium]|nr:endonuclease V [Anaerolineae bacterium]
MHVIGSNLGYIQLSILLVRGLSYHYLSDEGKIIGAVVRTRTGVKPVFVSIGHRVDLSRAVEMVLACGRGYRLPEPTRWADKIAGGKSLPFSNLPQSRVSC